MKFRFLLSVMILGMSAVIHGYADNDAGSSDVVVDEGPSIAYVIFEIACEPGAAYGGDR